MHKERRPQRKCVRIERDQRYRPDLGKLTGEISSDERIAGLSSLSSSSIPPPPPLSFLLPSRVKKDERKERGHKGKEEDKPQTEKIIKDRTLFFVPPKDTNRNNESKEGKEREQ